MLIVSLTMSAGSVGAAPTRHVLNADEIRATFVGQVVGDGYHWRYYLKPDGSVDGTSMGRSRKGYWSVRGQQLCLAIINDTAQDQCYGVVRKDKALIFRVNGQDFVDVHVEPPISTNH